MCPVTGSQSERQQVLHYFFGGWVQKHRGSLRFTAEAAAELWTLTCHALMLPHQMRPDGCMWSVCSVFLFVCGIQNIFLFFPVLASISEPYLLLQKLAHSILGNTLTLLVFHAESWMRGMEPISHLCTENEALASGALAYLTMKTERVVEQWLNLRALFFSVLITFFLERDTAIDFPPHNAVNFCCF